MDLLTQGLLGSAVAQCGAKNRELRVAAAIGFLSGLVADADVLIRSQSDPLLELEWHRHFTHSLFFVPIGALIAALLLYPWCKRWLNFSRIYLYSLLGYAFSGLLDVCTSYGTYILWPLVNERIAWYIIPIVDVIFTPVLLIFVVLGFVKYRRVFALIGLLFCASYLIFGTIQHQRILAVATDLATSRNHQVEAIIVKPSIGGLLLWRSIYAYDGKYYVDAIRAGIEVKIYKGESIDRFDAVLHIPQLPQSSRLKIDLARYTSLTAGYVVAQQSNGAENNLWRVGDLRYAILPNSIDPLWGIEFNLSTPEQHVDYRFYREITKTTRNLYVDMLLGKNIE